MFAASKKAGSLWKNAEKCLNRDNIPFCALFTGDAGNAMEISYKACVEGYRRFIAVGGDGTVHDVLNGIMRYVDEMSVNGGQVALSDFLFAVIPLGSGNDWIKTHGIPCDVSEAVSVISAGHTGKQDVVRAGILDRSALPVEKVTAVSYMANVGGVGLDARVCERVNREKQHGKRGKRLYVSALLYNLIHRKPAAVQVVCDGRTVFDGEYISIALGIGRYSGGGMRQTPEAVVDDGLLDMTVIPDLPVVKIAKEAPKLFTGKFLSVKELTFARSSSITVIPYSVDEPVEVDGEVVGYAPVRFDVLSEQLNIVIP